MSSSQLTNSYFFRGGETTNQFLFQGDGDDLVRDSPKRPKKMEILGELSLLRCLEDFRIEQLFFSLAIIQMELGYLDPWNIVERKASLSGETSYLQVQ